jgi:hypothetical protein
MKTLTVFTTDDEARVYHVLIQLGSGVSRISFRGTYEKTSYSFVAFKDRVSKALREL